jgi:hypothetical protein
MTDDEMGLWMKIGLVENSSMSKYDLRD